MSTINTATVTHAHSAPDFAAVKLRQQATWSSGDFSVVAARIVYQAEQLCETAELQAGWRVLDVATRVNLIDSHCLHCPVEVGPHHG